MPNGEPGSEAEQLERERASNRARARSRARVAFEAMGLPGHLFDFCEIWFDGDGTPTISQVTISSPQDASASDLKALAERDVSLEILPVGDFDLREMQPSLRLFAMIVGKTRVYSRAEQAKRFPETEKTYGPYWGEGRPSGRCLHLDVLETATALTRLAWLDNDDQPHEEVDLSRLPALREVSETGFIRSAVRNPHIRVIDVGLTLAPGDLESDAPLEEITLRVPRTFRDMSRFRNLSKLTRLDLRGPATFDLSSLADCSVLERLSVIECREILGVETLLRLPNLRWVEFESPRVMPGHEVLRDLPFDFALSNNYIMSETQRADVIGTMQPGRKAWIGRVKGAKRPATTENTRLNLVGRSDETSFAPFTVTLAEEGGFEVVFDDWAGLADLLLGDDSDEAELDAAIAEELAIRILAKDATVLVRSGRIEFDSETEFVRLHLASRDDAELTARTLALAWKNKRRLRSLVRDLL